MPLPLPLQLPLAVVPGSCWLSGGSLWVVLAVIHDTPAGFLHPLLVSSNRFLEIALDFVGPLFKSNGYDCILIMTDRLTDYILIEPTVMTATAPEIVLLFYKTWYRRFGLSTAITSDRDKLFVS